MGISLGIMLIILISAFILLGGSGVFFLWRITHWIKALNTSEESQGSGAMRFFLENELGRGNKCQK